MSASRDESERTLVIQTYDLGLVTIKGTRAAENGTVFGVTIKGYLESCYLEGANVILASGVYHSPKAATSVNSGYGLTYC